MRIVRLEAQNIKRLKAVEITPSGDLVVVGGQNGQGKTSLLDAIWVALGGPAKDKNPQMLRQGAESGHVTLDLGELVVHRTWKGDSTALKVTNPEGAAFSSPQRKLDELIGSLSFDPLAFTRMPPKVQVKTLLDLLELPFDPEKVRADRKSIYDERTAVNRLAETLKGALDQSDLDSLPKRKVDIQRERTRLQEWTTQEREWAAAQRAHDEATRRRSLSQERLDLAVLEAQEAQLAVEKTETALASLAEPDHQVRIELEAALDSAAETNALYERRLALSKTAEEYNAAVIRSAELTEEIAQCDRLLADGLKDAALPVEGLAFGDDGVTFRGVPFVQCSSAEQLRVSAAMAMAMNPTIRIMRIEDGSLLDDGNLAVLAGMATENDFQVWIERVGSGGAIEIVDGQVSASPVGDEDEPW